MRALRRIWQGMGRALARMLRLIGSALRFLWRWALRLVLVLAVLLLGLLSPVAYTEMACRAPMGTQDYQPLIADPDWQRPESRSLTTYPEWHIVYAYQDYAEVIAKGDPHAFAYTKAIAGFWSSLCPLAKLAAGHGGFDTASKMTIYTIGVSFTAELLLKAAYEESFGRLATLIRGKERAALDEVSARQAADYAVFLHQTPWYKWDFRRDLAELRDASRGSFRDRERLLALGLEYRAKAAYAGAIAEAVAATGEDQLRMRSIVRGLPADWFGAEPEVAVISERPEGVEIETPRYAEFTELARRIAAAGGDFVEIAGNDEILITMLAPNADPAMLYSVQRQGFGDWRQLALVPVADLASAIRAMRASPRRLEHIYDY